MNQSGGLAGARPSIGAATLNNPAAWSVSSEGFRRLMRPYSRPGLVLIVGVLAASSRLLLGADSSADTTAKYLAGMAVPAAAADPAAAESPWVVHSRDLDRAWQRTEHQQLPAIASWAPSFLGTSHPDTSTVFYMFSGPDFLYAHAFFANARTYILCGTEPVGDVPDLTTIPPQDLAATLANLRNSLDSVLSWSFFITKNMKADLIRTKLNGTLPLLYVFLARTGCTIDSVTPVTVDQTGNIREEGSGDTPGVRIAMTNSSGVSQTLYYFCTDLSDDGIKSKPGFLRFCENQGRGVSLLKAASYLMHEPGFARIRAFLLNQSDVIVQDDSGIPVRFFDPQEWSIRYCGKYVGPIDIFKQYWQSDLANVYARVVPSPLPFSFGYRWQPARSDVIIAARVGTEIASLASNQVAPVEQPDEVPRAEPADDQPQSSPAPEARRPRRPASRNNQDRLPIRF